MSFGSNLLTEGLTLAKSIKEHTLDKYKKKDELTDEQLEHLEMEKQAKKRMHFNRAFEFFISNSATIEVIRNDNIEIVYFILLPYVLLLPKEKKVEFHDMVDRSSTKSKV